MRKILVLFFVTFLFQVQFCIANEEANKMSYEGIMLIQKGKWDEGLTLMKEAIQITPDEAGLHMNYGSMLFMKGQKVFETGNKQEATVIFQEVEKELLSAIKLFNDKDAKGIILISHCYFLLGDVYYYFFQDLGQAKNFYQKSLDYDSGHGGAIEAMRRFN